ncbi:hypothetical protein [Haloarchaeobius iranensis]|nr:hypothetical protein [Haloarchaeobius iranensis]
MAASDEYHDRVAQLFQQASGLEDGITLTSHMLKHSRDAVGAILHDES